jgi:hypothetical protein
MLRVPERILLESGVQEAHSHDPERVQEHSYGMRGANRGSSHFDWFA